jgi:hypothetical protein
VNGIIAFYAAVTVDSPFAPLIHYILKGLSSSSRGEAVVAPENNKGLQFHELNHFRPPLQQLIWHYNMGDTLDSLEKLLQRLTSWARCGEGSLYLRFLLKFKNYWIWGLRV